LSQQLHLENAGGSVVVGVGDDIHHDKAGYNINGVRYIVDRRYPLLKGKAEDNNVER
jgi:hypothetical protein